MTRAQVNNFIAQHLWKIVLLAFTIGGVWAQQVSALGSKVDRREFNDSLQVSRKEIMIELRHQGETLKEIEKDGVVVKKLLCKKNPNDSWCVDGPK